MRTFSKLRLLRLQLIGVAALAFALVGNLGVDFQARHFGQSNSRCGLDVQISLKLQGDRAEARANSGGRSRGGSFSRPASRSSSRRSSSTPTRSHPGNFGSNGSSFDYRAPNRSYHPSGYGYSNPGYGYSNSGYVNATNSGWILMLLGLLSFIVLFICIFMLLRFIQRVSQKSGIAPAQEFDASLPNALQNDTVTVTQLQVALLAQAREIQTHLSELTANADTETPAGLTELLQEAVLTLLRSPESWTHVRTLSQTFKDRESAAKLFEQLSIAERSKFIAETLVNVGGSVRRQAIGAENHSDPAAYIVVTLLMGTEDDRPLIGSIHSTEELKGVLQRLGTITPESLSIFELIWSPQDVADSLTADELLAEYADLKQLI